MLETEEQFIDLKEIRSYVVWMQSHEDILIIYLSLSFQIFKRKFEMQGTGHGTSGLICD